MPIKKLPPILQSEITSRLRALDPDITALLNAPEIPMSGEELETLLAAIYVVGYAAALEEGEGGEIAQWAS